MTIYPRTTYSIAQRRLVSNIDQAANHLKLSVFDTIIVTSF